MSLYRRAAKRDGNEPAIVDRLEALGFSVNRLSIPGGPDLLLARNGICRVAEVKTEKGKLRELQELWWGRWKGHPLILLRTPEDAEALSRKWLRVHAK